MRNTARQLNDQGTRFIRENSGFKLSGFILSIKKRLFKKTKPDSIDKS